MDPITLAVGLPIATLAVLLIKRKKNAAVVEPIDLGEIDDVIVPRPPAPPAPPGGTRVPVIPVGGDLPAGRVATARVNTPSGALLRSAPVRTGTNILAVVSNGALLAIMEEGPPLPPTAADAAAAPGGWQRVTTTTGLSGFVSASLLQFLPPAAPAAMAGVGSLGWSPWRSAKRPR